MSKDRIGEILVEMGVLSEADVAAILEHQKRTRQKFGQIARAWGLATDEQVWEAWSTQIARFQRHVDPDEMGLDTDAIARVDGEVARYFNVLPLRLWGEHLVVATADLPATRPRLEELPQVLGCKVHYCLCKAEKVDEHLTRAYGASTQQTAVS